MTIIRIYLQYKNITQIYDTQAQYFLPGNFLKFSKHLLLITSPDGFFWKKIYSKSEEKRNHYQIKYNGSNEV